MINFPSKKLSEDNHVLKQPGYFCFVINLKLAFKSSCWLSLCHSNIFFSIMSKSFLTFNFAVSVVGVQAWWLYYLKVVKGIKMARVIDWMSTLFLMSRVLLPFCTGFGECLQFARVDLSNNLVINIMELKKTITSETGRMCPHVTMFCFNSLRNCNVCCFKSVVVNSDFEA